MMRKRVVGGMRMTTHQGLKWRRSKRLCTVSTSFGGVLAMLRFHRGYHIDPAGVEDMSHEMATALTGSVEKALLKLNAA
jgi:hypothetical protein